MKFEISVDIDLPPAAGVYARSGKEKSITGASSHHYAEEGMLRAPKVNIYKLNEKYSRFDKSFFQASKCNSDHGNSVKILGEIW